MACPTLPDDAFGDRFELAALPLPRPAAGYAVQHLNTDQLLDPRQGEFRPIRSLGAQALFASFDLAHAAAAQWVHKNTSVDAEHGLAIVPAGFDDILERPVLIYGVLCGQP